jgi:hypothetical protein
MLRTVCPLMPDCRCVPKSTRGQGGNSKVNLKRCSVSLHRIEVPGLDAMLAAAVRCRHAHTAAFALHLTAAGMLPGSHAAIREGTRHSGCEQS